MRLSELPVPFRPQDAVHPRVVTLGGGHGQSALLVSLVGLECEIAAVVSIADDGGCSGKLRAELGMPPPGDIRRCLVSLSTRAALAAQFEERLHEGVVDGRCVGNLVIAEMAQDLGSLQRAVDWAAALLGCVGRVIPAAEEAGTLSVYDLVHGSLSGESNIERLSGRAVVATVDGPEQASGTALSAIAQADFVLFGPGSFLGSTLAVLTTADIASSVVASGARRVLLRNIGAEGPVGSLAAVHPDDHERVLRDHLVIGGGGESVSFDVLSHDPARLDFEQRADGSVEWFHPLADPSGHRHDRARLAAALHRQLGLAWRNVPPQDAVDVPPEAQAIFDRYLASARARLFG